MSLVAQHEQSTRKPRQQGVTSGCFYCYHVFEQTKQFSSTRSGFSRVQHIRMIRASAKFDSQVD